VFNSNGPINAIKEINRRTSLNTTIVHHTFKLRESLQLLRILSQPHWQCHLQGITRLSP